MFPQGKTIRRALCFLGLAVSLANAREPQEPQRKEAEAQTPANPPATADDPFAGVAPTEQTASETKPQPSWVQRFFQENFGFRKEIMSQFDTMQHEKLASRQSAGFEVLKKFSSQTRTIASFDFQGRLVRRDRYNPVLNDMEGAMRPGWAFEYHNLYLDFYNVLDPLLGENARRQNLGRFNFRVGRFYVPFGLNLQTDTHGTVLQLSNERNFGFERDWYAGFQGSLNRYLNYDAYYLTGSGYDVAYKGQSGLGALRLSLANHFSSRYGLEGGVSVLAGERLDPEATERLHSKAAPIETRRVGLDGRYRKPVSNGTLTFTSELSGGADQRISLFTQLHQAEYLHSSRRWGVAAQYRRFAQDGLGADASMIAEFTWYFRNDVASSNLHWIKLNVERQIERMHGPPATVIALQYYFYR
ncbi:MAG: hypothetical protein U0Q16_15345 [Bryobacteraceae bacterium]